MLHHLIVLLGPYLNWAHFLVFYIFYSYFIVGQAIIFGESKHNDKIYNFIMFLFSPIVFIGILFWLCWDKWKKRK